MKIIGQSTLPPDLFRSAPRNANHMSDERYEALKAGIAAEGFLQPVLGRPVEDGKHNCEVIDGHHRVRAAAELGLGPIPVVLVECDDAEAARLAIGLNRRRGELNLTEVSAIFSELLDVGCDPVLLAATGFSQEEVDTLIAAAQEETPEIPPSMDDVPQELTGEPTKPWVIELQFTDKAEHAKAKRGLRRAAGKGVDLSVGLLRLLGE